MTAVATLTEADKIISQALGKVGEIASLPELTTKIIRIVENPRSTARDLFDVIRCDPALSARILKVVNSAFYGLPGQIANIDRAIVLLGLSAVKNIAVAASMTHLFNGGAQIDGLGGVDLWKHSLAVGVGCKMLTAAQGRPLVEESFLAGLIHDIGILIERQVFAEKLGEVINKQKTTGSSFSQLEREIIGADHGAFGMALATKWRFPAPLCTAIGYHHKSMDVAAGNRELSVLVHVADVLACNAGIGCTLTATGEIYDEEMLATLNLTPDDIAEIAAKLPEQVAISESVFTE
jgi:HD-like signal output (HDOD) protein